MKTACTWKILDSNGNTMMVNDRRTCQAVAKALREGRCGRAKGLPKVDAVAVRG